MIVVKFSYKGDEHYSFTTGLEYTPANVLRTKEALQLVDHSKITFPENWDKWRVIDEE